MKKHAIPRINLLACLTLLAGPGVMPAAQATGVSLHGTLVSPPPCTISEGKQIDVNFGERIGIKKIDGVNYRRTLNYRITCEKGSSAWVLKLTLGGNAPSFDSNALKSNRTGLAIRMYQNDKPFPPNSTLTINLNNPPALEVVPVKDTAAAPTKGSFDVWATLKADYQ